MGIPEVEVREKGEERLLKEIIPGNFPNLKKGLVTQVHKTHSTP